jgi:hypothetical protein
VAPALGRPLAPSATGRRQRHAPGVPGPRRLSRAILELARDECDVLFNTPNDRSRSAYLRLGWQLAGWMPLWVRVRRPVRLALGARTTGRAAAGTIEVEAPAVADVLDDPRLAGLLEEAGPADDRLCTDWDPSYLRWRYAAVPGLDHRVVVDERVGELRGLAVLCVRPRGRLWEAQLLDVFTRAGDRGAVRRLVEAAARAAPVDFVSCSFPVRPSRFVRKRPGIALTVWTPRPLDPDPAALRSWSLSLGDVEQL